MAPEGDYPSDDEGLELSTELSGTMRALGSDAGTGFGYSLGGTDQAEAGSQDAGEQAEAPDVHSDDGFELELEGEVVDGLVVNDESLIRVLDAVSEAEGWADLPDVDRRQEVVWVERSAKHLRNCKPLNDASEYPRRSVYVKYGRDQPGAGAL